MIKLTEIAATDSIQLHRLRTNAVVAKFIARDIDQKVSDIDKFIFDIINDSTKLFYKIETVINEEFIGAISLKNIDFQAKYAEVGYELFPEYQGRGYMSEALTKIIDLVFGEWNFEILEAYTHHQNMSSRTLLEKFNFKVVEDKIDTDNLNNVVYELKKACI
jgi:ribosomal-protein-alanine N-acetyltransferase